MTATTKILDRLEGVKSTGPGRWIARCPAHEDRSPSLSIRELDDGRALIHDFGGCTTSDVVAAIGLELCDLFERSLGDFKPSRSRVPARDLLELIDAEALVIGMIALQIRESHAVTNENWARLATAAARIGRARDHIHGG